MTLARRFVDPTPRGFRSMHRAFVTTPEPESEPEAEPAAAVAERAPAPNPSPAPLDATDPLALASTPIDDDLVRTLVEPLAFGETAHGGFARKHAAILALFDRLTPAECADLRQRLANARTGDAVAAAFDRMSRERRGHLLAYLADAPRREMLRRVRPRR